MIAAAHGGWDGVPGYCPGERCARFLREIRVNRGMTAETRIQGK